jgi:NAD(P)-dependent dehydrogenase (short-subunit alcohol dehydrogenase family)
MISFDFSGKVAIVTGAGGGMGETLARSLAAAGAKVAAVDLKPAPASLSGLDGVAYAEGDLRDLGFVQRVADEAYARWGRLDHLANVAGVLWFGRDASALEMDLGVWDEVMAINLKTMVHTSRAAVPLMRRSGGGAMVHVSTIQWMRGDPQPQDAYQASKAAVSAFSRSLAMQLAADGIRSNVICPGPTRTPMQARWDGDPQALARVADYVPLKRIGTPEDIAQAAMFLLSDAAGYITGIDVPVDGGMLLRC